MPYPEDDETGRFLMASFREELVRLGWTEGRQVRIAYHWSGGDAGRIRAVAADLAALHPDVLLVNSTQLLVALREAARDVPLVFVNVGDPVGRGLVQSLARPGGNTTGFANTDDEISGKWVAVLKEIAPNCTRVLVVGSKDNPAWHRLLPKVQEAAATLAVKLVTTDAVLIEELERSVATFSSEAGGGLVVMPSIFTSLNRRRIIELARRYRLPAAYPVTNYVALGGLISYAIDTIEQYRGAAAYIDRILQGERAGDLPVQQATKFKLMINLRTARDLGLEVPAALLARADEVVE